VLAEEWSAGVVHRRDIEAALPHQDPVALQRVGRRREGASTVRMLRELSWSRAGATVTARVVADAFCHSMVRALVGAAVAVGEGRLAPDRPRQVLEARVRDPRVTVLAPHGLTLEEVAYPANSDLAFRASTARTRRGTAR
jgi:tRNA pseudouridine38-40 synthase